MVDILGRCGLGQHWINLSLPSGWARHTCALIDIGFSLPVTRTEVVTHEHMLYAMGKPWSACQQGFQDQE